MNRSRRTFLASGLALPVVASASRSEQAPQTPAKSQSPAKALSSGPELRYKTLGKTGLKVTTVGFGCMITSDGSVVERAADLGITYFDTARNYQSGNNERMVGAALKKKRKDLVLSTKTEGRTKEDALAQLDTSLKELGTDFVDIWYLHGKTKPDRRHRRPDRGAADRQEGRQDPLRRRQHAQRAEGTDSLPGQESEHRRDPDAVQLHHGAVHERGDR